MLDFKPHISLIIFKETASNNDSIGASVLCRYYTQKFRTLMKIRLVSRKFRVDTIHRRLELCLQFGFPFFVFGCRYYTQKFRTERILRTRTFAIGCVDTIHRSLEQQRRNGHKGEKEVQILWLGERRIRRCEYYTQKFRTLFFPFLSSRPAMVWILYIEVQNSLET